MFRSLPALRKSRGRFWEWRRRAIPRRVFLTSSNIPRDTYAPAVAADALQMHSQP